MMELQIENVEPTIGLEVQEVMEGEGSGTRNYEKLMNKPSINEVELSGDKSFQELGLSPLSNLDIIQIINKASEGGIINETDINPPAELGRLADASGDKRSTRI